MPVYEYNCQDCQKPFELARSMTDSSNTRDLKCPECGSQRIERTYSQVFAKTSKKS